MVNRSPSICAVSFVQPQSERAKATGALAAAALFREASFAEEVNEDAADRAINLIVK